MVTICASICKQNPRRRKTITKSVIKLAKSMNLWACSWRILFFISLALKTEFRDFVHFSSKANSLNLNAQSAVFNNSNAIGSQFAIINCCETYTRYKKSFSRNGIHVSIWRQAKPICCQLAYVCLIMAILTNFVRFVEPLCCKSWDALKRSPRDVKHAPWLII